MLTVTARDTARLTQLLASGERSYAHIAKAVGVSKTYIGHLATGKRDRVSVEVAGRIETALGLDRGDLFHLDPLSRKAAAPYLT